MCNVSGIFLVFHVECMQLCPGMTIVGSIVAGYQTICLYAEAVIYMYSKAPCSEYNALQAT